jgi:putative Mg2+ transporter-C (MgtC) family protein
MRIRFVSLCVRPWFFAASVVVAAAIAIWQGVEPLGKLTLALGLGGAVGLERAWRQNAAGVRCTGFVALASAAYTLRALSLGGGIPCARVLGNLAQAAGAIGLVVVVKEGLSLTGLATAATLFGAGAVGAAAGSGAYVEAATIAALLLVTNTVMSRRDPATK